ncbi:hypothetical protein BD413DRAFT_585335 [Trametes elegans]|nr:hypothetical protein BD413DRAFT_585335 [Trametes elegans]
MADLSDPKIDEAYQDVRSDKTDTNWLLVDYESDRSDKLQLTATGSGGLEELREKLDDSKASYAYVRVQYANDKESKREKFILVVWIGPQCKVMRKAKVCPSFALPPALSLGRCMVDAGACRSRFTRRTSRACCACSR